MAWHVQVQQTVGQQDDHDCCPSWLSCRETDDILENTANSLVLTTISVQGKTPPVPVRSGGSRPSWSRVRAGCSNRMQVAQGHNMTPDSTVNLHWCSECYEGLHTSRINTTLFTHPTLLPHLLTPPTCHSLTPPTCHTHSPHPPGPLARPSLLALWGSWLA